MTYTEFNQSDKKVFKNFYNGILPSLILWIISKEDIHGYGIMKKLNDLFNFDQYTVNVNSSKIYPILSRLEKNGFIAGEWKINESNKSVKFYSITDEGNEFLKVIQNQLQIVFKNPVWKAFFDEMTGQ
jgi:DNA-binding PadR family transcriptional regulator